MIQKQVGTEGRLQLGEEIVVGELPVLLWRLASLHVPLGVIRQLKLIETTVSIKPTKVRVRNNHSS